MTLGPPALVFNWPETASMASRISSACNRRRSNRQRDRKSTRLNSSHGYISYAVFCLKKKKHTSELQSRLHLVCRLLLEKKKKVRLNNIVRLIKTFQQFCSDDTRHVNATSSLVWMDV